MYYTLLNKLHNVKRAKFESRSMFLYWKKLVFLVRFVHKIRPCRTCTKTCCSTWKLLSDGILPVCLIDHNHIRTYVWSKCQSRPILFCGFTLFVAPACCLLLQCIFQSPLLISSCTLLFVYAGELLEVPFSLFLWASSIHFDHLLRRGGAARGASLLAYSQSWTVHVPHSDETGEKQHRSCSATVFLSFPHRFSPLLSFPLSSFKQEMERPENNKFGYAYMNVLGFC